MSSIPPAFGGKRAESQRALAHEQRTVDLEVKYDFPRPQMVAFIPEDARRLLEVGCGSGAFAWTLRRHRPSLEYLRAVEPDPAAAELASHHFDRVDIGTFPAALSGELDLFDCIVFNDVLEHMADPTEALKAARLLLNQRGRIVASIPNLRHYTVTAPLVARGEFRYTDRGILDSTHLRFFTRRSMIRLFESTGYRVIQAHGINMRRLHRAISKAFFGLPAEFLYPQYAIVAEPCEPSTA